MWPGPGSGIRWVGRPLLQPRQLYRSCECPLWHVHDTPGLAQSACASLMVHYNCALPVLLGCLPEQYNLPASGLYLLLCPLAWYSALAYDLILRLLLTSSSTLTTSSGLIPSSGLFLTLTSRAAAHGPDLTRRLLSYFLQSVFLSVAKANWRTIQNFLRVLIQISKEINAPIKSAYLHS